MPAIPAALRDVEIRDVLPFAPGQADPRKVPGLVGWWDARYLDLPDGTPVGAWPDLSGNGFDMAQATSSKKPIFHASGYTGAPAVRFDGADDYMEVMAYGTKLLSDTITAVASIQNTAIPVGADLVVYITPGESPWVEWAVQTADWYGAINRVCNDSSDGKNAGVLSPTAAHLVAAARVNSGTSIDFDITANGSRNTQTLTGSIYRSSTNADRFRIGNNSNPIAGDVYWVTVYDRWLSASELAYLGVQVP